MAKKKKTPVTEVDGSVEEVFYEAAQVVCGHVNRHFINSRGELEDLTCKLPKGHEGDHWSKFISLVTDYGVDERTKRQIVIGTHEKEKDGWWSDGASIPVSPVVITPEQDFERLKKTRNHEHGTPEMQPDEDLTRRLDKEIRGAFSG